MEPTRNPHTSLPGECQHQLMSGWCRLEPTAKRLPEAQGGAPAALVSSWDSTSERGVSGAAALQGRCQACGPQHTQSRLQVILRGQG